MGSILKAAAQFLRNQAWMWKKKSISETAREFLKILDSEWAAISAPAKYELVFFEHFSCHNKKRLTLNFKINENKQN